MARRWTWRRLQPGTMFAVLILGSVVVGGGSEAAKPLIKIVTQSPLSGEQSALGEQIKLGAQLAVDEAKARMEKLGYTLQYIPFDDQAKPDVGVANAKHVVADPDVLLVIGHFNSGVALPSSEVYRDVSLPMISPANTHPMITDRNYANVNRVCGRDDVQGPVGARFAVQDLKVKSVYVLHDKTLYGQGVAEAFRDEAKKLGLQVLGYEGTEEKSNFDPILIPVKAKNPDLVYFGGIYPQAAVILRQMREKGIKAAFMGPDGLDSSEMAKIAGKAVVGSYYTTVAGPPSAYREAAAFVKTFKQRFGKDSESFSMYAYDATAVGIKAIEAAIKDAKGKKPTREQVAAAVRQVKHRGITGDIRFDSKGDPLKAKYFVLKFEKEEYPGKIVKVLEIEAPPLKKP
ncbi:MAG: branched-chain amino acid ABC transporter substrate-binding protein [candidate division NC10 bacterium]|jgi:branched-chain amino acid transport system substrate-binding protein|nr:branched-chain amino acid ABC transporter substrate-binding protein [candidate division NC10 bacterium]